MPGMFAAELAALGAASRILAPGATETQSAGCRSRGDGTALIRAAGRFPFRFSLSDCPQEAHLLRRPKDGSSTCRVTGYANAARLLDALRHERNVAALLLRETYLSAPSADWIRGGALARSFAVNRLRFTVMAS
jgi:hypothetical protein